MPRACPSCDQGLTRTRRQPWMRRIPGSKYYICKQCDAAYMLIFDRWLLKWKRYASNRSGSKGTES
jgi:hypothetical protein